MKRENRKKFCLITLLLNCIPMRLNENTGAVPWWVNTAITFSKQIRVRQLFWSSHLPPVVVSELELPSICSPGGCGFILAVFSGASASTDATPPSVCPDPAPPNVICPSGLVCFSIRLFSESTSTWAAAISLGLMLLSFCSLWFTQHCPTRFPLFFFHIWKIWEQTRKL